MNDINQEEYIPDTIIIIIGQSSYTESNKQSIKKYAKANPDKIKQIKKKYYDTHCKTDEYRTKQKDYLKKYYSEK